jgi:hypothetical protein
MKAITLYEPYASLMRIGAKINETRGQRTNHRAKDEAAIGTITAAETLLGLALNE